MRAAEAGSLGRMAERAVATVQDEATKKQLQAGRERHPIPVGGAAIPQRRQANDLARAAAEADAAQAAAAPPQQPPPVSTLR